MGENETRLSFYDHHRQSYGHLPISGGDDRVAGEFMVGDYGDGSYGVDEGGEFAIHLIPLGDHGYFPRDKKYLAPMLRVFTDATGSLRAFLDSGAWDAVAKAAQAKDIHSRDDVTALLVASGLRDRSEYPVGHKPVCDCCGQPVREPV